MSKEQLKTTLLELLRTDRSFVLALLAELMPHLSKKTNPIASDQFDKLATSPQSSDKIIPVYRQELRSSHPQAGISEAEIIELRKLFSDEPPAEKIIEMIGK